MGEVEQHEADGGWGEEGGDVGGGELVGAFEIPGHTRQVSPLDSPQMEI